MALSFAIGNLELSTTRNSLQSTCDCSAVSEIVRPIEIGTLDILIRTDSNTNVFLSVPLDVGSELISTDLY